MATGVMVVYTVRLLTGLSTGLLDPPTAVCIIEVTKQRYRGAALAMITFLVSAGILAVHKIGTLHIPGPAAGISPMLDYVLRWFMPESPV